VDDPAGPENPERQYGPNESWIEPSGFRHRVTRNDGDEDAVWLVHSIIEEGKESGYYVEELKAAKL
jgi:hypothetical protein